jgi:hypothetical protein
MARRGAAADERGLSLVECLITVWILGAVVTAISGALFVMIRASDLDRRRALVETELRRYSEAIRGAEYVECATNWDHAEPSYAPAAVAHVPDASVAAGLRYRVRFLFRGEDHGDHLIDPARFVPAADDVRPAPSEALRAASGTRDLCDVTDDAAPTDDGVQEITITVADGGAPAARATTTILKRR